MYNYTNKYSYHLFSSYTPIVNIVTFAHSSRISQFATLLKELRGSVTEELLKMEDNKNTNMGS